MSDVKIVDRRWWAQGDSPVDTGSEPATKPSYVEDLERRLAEKDRQLQAYVDQVKSASREFDEGRVRLRRELAREVERSTRAVFVELLEVVDNLDRAIEAGRSAATVESLLEGVRLVRQQFLARLEGFGITPIPALRQPFDPALHEAVTTVPAATEDDADRVLGVIRPGYAMGDEVLRPAQVAVGNAVRGDQQETRGA